MASAQRQEPEAQAAVCLPVVCTPMASVQRQEPEAQVAVCMPAATGLRVRSASELGRYAIHWFRAC